MVISETENRKYCVKTLDFLSFTVDTFQNQIKLPFLFGMLVRGRSCVTYQRAHGSDLNLDPLGPSPESFLLYEVASSFRHWSNCSPQCYQVIFVLTTLSFIMQIFSACIHTLV